ncbi:MAG: hypothetical protein U0X76_02445, partial [Bacteroidia bacterium]
MKNIYILIWGLFFFGNGFAQSGQLDSTFGGNGLVSTPVALTGYSYARNVIPLSSGGYLATGYGFDGTSYAMTLIRYLNDGTQDALFGTFGKVTLSYNGLSTYGYNSTLQPDGKILVCGDYFDGISYTFCVARFLDNGSPDSSFGSNGIATFALGSGTHGNIGYSVGLQSNGKIIVSGGNYNGANYDYAAIRFKDNGTIDSSFGTNGATTIAVGTGNDNCYSMVIQDDDKIVLCGDYQNGSNYIFSIVRLNSNGSIDTNFGSNGISIQAVGSVDDDYGYTVLMQGNKILFGGTSKNSNGYDFTLGRLDSLGNLDS